MIPEAKQPVVTRALSEAFGVNEFEDIRLLSGGLTSALVFRIVVRGNPYLLRLIMRQEALYDPTRQFTCMKTASEAGIAPRIWYANVEDRVLITDFVDAKPFPDDAAPLIALTIRTLHSLPNFPKLLNYLDTMDGLIRRFQAAKILPESVTEELFRRYAEVARVYPRNDADLVASHNDLKPQNILFDGERIWLIDWEAAFLNDPYTDLAVVANFFVKDEAHEERFLSAYFGEPAGEYRSARFYLMRQAVHMFYISMFMLLAAGSAIPIDPDMTAPDFRDFHQRLISGEVDLATAEAKLQYAKVHLNEVLRNMRTQRFKDAVSRVAAFHAIV
jgi:aminoglycoside phosphotransferase (APT) family kinase protein